MSNLTGRVLPDQKPPFISVQGFDRDDVRACINGYLFLRADAFNRYAATIESQAAEIARLREALERIIALEDDFDSTDAMTGHEWQMIHNARAALKGDDDATGN